MRSSVGDAGAAATATGIEHCPSQDSTTPQSHKVRRPARLLTLCVRMDDAPPFVVTGQTAKALHALVAAGDKGITAMECGGWAFRLAAYVRELRKRGLAIETMRERHDDAGGWHGRYVLRSAVIVEAVGE